MRHPIDVILPAAVIAIAPSAFDTITAVTANAAAGDPWSGEFSPWVLQAVGGAALGWAGVVLAAFALFGHSELLRLLTTLTWIAAAVVAWSTPTSLAYIACALVGLLSARDARERRGRPRLHWSERNASVRAGVIVTLLSGPLAVFLGAVALLVTTVGTTLMAVGSLAESDGLHGGADSARASMTADTVRHARLRRHRIHAGNLCLGAGLIATATLVYSLVGPTVSGIDPTAIVLFGGLFVVALPMLATGLIMGASTAAESRRLRRLAEAG